MFILKKGHQPGVYVPLRALFLVCHTLLNLASSSYKTYHSFEVKGTNWVIL